MVLEPFEYVIAGFVSRKAKIGPLQTSWEVRRKYEEDADADAVFTFVVSVTSVWARPVTYDINDSLNY